MNRILVVDDDANLRYSFHKIFTGHDYEIVEAASGEEALAAIAARAPDLIILDIRLPGMSGLETLSAIKERAPKVPVIVMTAYGTTETAIDAMQRGAYDYTLKPFNVEEMQELVAKGIAASNLMNRPVTYRRVRSWDKGDAIVGKSKLMQQVYKQIGQVAASDVTVLVTGESGTGKELVVRAIYHYSRRADKPFLVVNCTAIPETLLESELFGYEKGAFTGAVNQKVGKFEQVNGGTIFLDEIGDLSLATQAKLLRVLQEQTLERLGSNRTIRIDVRVLAATNKDLAVEVNTGRFREDLLYRLNVFVIRVPPLRERREDIPELTEYFLARFSRERHAAFTRIAEPALAKLVAYDWPGNVRELANVVRRAVVVGTGDILLAEYLLLPGEAGGDEPNGKRVAVPGDPLFDELLQRAEQQGEPLLDAAERYLIIRALERAGGNQVQAARLLGMSRHTLAAKVKKYRLVSEVRLRTRS